MTLTIKPSHVVAAEKMAESIYNRCPVEQQEMMDTIKHRMIKLNEQHLEILKK